MAVEMSELIMSELMMAPRHAVDVLVPWRPNSTVTRLVRSDGDLSDAQVNDGALVLAEPDALARIRTAAEARTTLAAIREAGVVGIVALGPLELPTDVINAFRQLKLFLGAVPELERSPRDAAEFREALQQALDGRAERDRKQLIIVQQLLSAMNEDNPIAAVVEELARQCEGSAMLYDSAGSIVESAGAAPVHLIHAELGGRDLFAGAFSIGRWRVIGRELRIRTQSYVLVLASRAPGVLEEYGQFILDSVVRLLGSFQALDSFALVQQVQNSSQLLREIELGVPPGKERQYWDRMSEFGFSPFSQLRYIIATTGGHSLSRAELDSITRFVGRAGVPVLVSENIGTSERDPGFRLIAEASPALDEWLAGFTGTLAVGVSQPYSQLSATPEEARATQTAESLARRNLAGGGAGASTVVFVDRLAPADWLLARARSARDRAQLEKYVAPLREHEELLRTLLVYFREGLRIVEGARALGIHQNTLRYRLGKIESVLGVRLGEPATIANLYLALGEELAQ